MLSCSNKSYPSDDLCGYSSISNIFKEYVPDRRIEIADMGCGYSGLLMDLYKDGYQFLTGVDIDGDIVSRLRDKANAVSSIEWICADLRSLPLPPETFGCIMLKNVISEESLSMDICSVIEAIHEVHRTLCSGGILISINTLTQAQAMEVFMGPGLTWSLLATYNSRTPIASQGKSAPYTVIVFTKE